MPLTTLDKKLMAPDGAQKHVEVKFASFDNKCSVRLAGLMPLLSYVLCSSTRTYMLMIVSLAFKEQSSGAVEYLAPFDSSCSVWPGGQISCRAVQQGRPCSEGLSVLIWENNDDVTELSRLLIPSHCLEPTFISIQLMAPDGARTNVEVNFAPFGRTLPLQPGRPIAPAGAQKNVEVNFAPFDRNCRVRLGGLTPLLS